MKFNTTFTLDAQAKLRSIELPTARRILAKLTGLEADPYGYGSTGLVGRPGVRRLRVGEWRVVYEVRNETLVVLVVHVAHRSEVDAR